MPSLPLILLSAVLASLYAGIFHVFKGKAVIDLPVFWAASLIGFAAGQVAAYGMKLNLLMIGDLHLIEGSLASVGVLLVVRWLKI